MHHNRQALQTTRRLVWQVVLAMYTEDLKLAVRVVGLELGYFPIDFLESKRIQGHMYQAPTYPTTPPYQVLGALRAPSHPTVPPPYMVSG